MTMLGHATAAGQSGGVSLRNCGDSLLARQGRQLRFQAANQGQLADKEGQNFGSVVWHLAATGSIGYQSVLETFWC